MEIVKNKYSLRILVEGEEVAYLIYSNNLNRYWAPNIFINMLEVTNKTHRRLGLGSILINELKNLFPNEIITCEIMVEGETPFEILQDFYYKLGFEKILDIGYSNVLALIPEGRSIEELGQVPKEILYREVVENEKTEYNLYHTWIDDIQSTYHLEFDSTEDFDYFYTNIQNGEVFKALSYY